MKSVKSLIRRAAALALLLVLLAGCTSPSADPAVDDEPDPVVSEDPAPVGEDMVIPKSALSETARFYTVDVEGTPMEIIALLTSDGVYRTSFNTCESCYKSGKGYYEQEGDELVCQNCSMRFSITVIGEPVEPGGCHPWPILQEDRMDTEDSLVIPYSYLVEKTEEWLSWPR